MECPTKAGQTTSVSKKLKAEELAQCLIQAFVSATYYLEGDGPLVFCCYERLATVSNAVAVAAYSNVEGVARRQAVGNLPVYNQLAEFHFF